MRCTGTFSQKLEAFTSCARLSLYTSNVAQKLCSWPMSNIYGECTYSIQISVTLIVNYNMHLQGARLFFFFGIFVNWKEIFFLQLIGALSLCIEPVFVSGRRNILLRCRFNKLSLYFAHQIG